MSVKKRTLNRRGVSEMISYVLLVVIAIALSVMVYAYLAVQVPKDRAECPPDTKLVVEQWSCSVKIFPGANNTILTDVILYNKGLRNVQAAYLRLGNDLTTKSRINLNTNDYFLATGSTLNAKTVQGLLPGRSYHRGYTYYDMTQEFTNAGKKVLEIEPALWDTKKLSLCESSTIRQVVECDLCGNGITNAPVEACDGGTCCTNVCKLKPGCTLPPSGNTLPTISLTSPTSGQSFPASATISLAATAADTDGTITKVEFFANSNKIGEGTIGQSYTFNWLSVPAGTYSLTANAIDNKGATTISAAVAVTVGSVPPAEAITILRITSPTNGATFSSGSTIKITAEVFPKAGRTITQVVFFAAKKGGGTISLGSLTIPISSTPTSSIYELTWVNPSSGEYILIAAADDDLGSRIAARDSPTVVVS